MKINKKTKSGRTKVESHIVNKLQRIKKASTGVKGMNSEIHHEGHRVSDRCLYFALDILMQDSPSSEDTL